MGMEQDYTEYLSNKKSLKGANFDLPMERCWDLVPQER